MIVPFSQQIGTPMNKHRRARVIIDHVQNMDQAWGKAGPPRSERTDKPSRIISADCRWEARVTREDQKGADGELWDLIELFAHGQLRMTAAFRGEQIDLRLYRPGPWEPLFNIYNAPDGDPVGPNDGIDWAA
jgi:hypothetical protein